jgi:hypothetical protein
MTGKDAELPLVPVLIETLPLSINREPLDAKADGL